MNGEDVVIGGRYVVGPEPTFRIGVGVLSSTLNGGEVVTARRGPDADGDISVEDNHGLTYDVDPRHLTPYVESDAAGDDVAAHLLESPANAAWLRESAWRNEAHAVLKEARDEIAALRERAEKAEAELHAEAEAHQDTRVLLEDEKVKVQRLDEAVAQLRERAEKAEAERDKAFAEKDMHKERADNAVAGWDEARVNWNEAEAELNELRAAPQLPADLPVVESVETIDSEVSVVGFKGLASVYVSRGRGLDFIAAGLAVLAAEAAKPDPVEELAQVILEDDEDTWESWGHIDERERFRYRRMARAAIAWTEKRDA